METSLKLNTKAEWITHLRNCPDTVSYTTDHEFRNVLRRIFQFDPKSRITYFGDNADEGALIPENELDAITADEIAFDQDAIDRGLTLWYQWTEDDPDFLELYTHAAYKMITLNPEVGQCVVASYQSFDDYYSSIRAYLCTEPRKKINRESISRLLRFYHPDNKDGNNQEESPCTA